MPTEYTINANPAQALGVRVARIELRSMDVSRAVLEVTDAEVFDGDLFHYGAIIFIAINGFTIFQGTVARTPESRAPNSYAQSIEIHDGWKELKEKDATEPWNADLQTLIGDGGSAVTLGVPGITLQRDSNNVYSRFHSTMGTPPTIGDEMARTMQAAINRGARIAPGDYSNSTSVLTRNLNNPSVADILRDLSSTTPAMVSWFDYGETPPRLNIKEPTASISLSLSDQRITKVRLVPRDDLLVKEAEIIFQDNHQGSTFPVVTQSAGDGAAGTGRKLEIKYTVPPSSQWTTEENDTLADSASGRCKIPIPTGLAQSIVTAYRERFFEGEITLKDEAASVIGWMGRRLSIFGGVPAWASMNATIIGVTVDLLMGETTISVGPNRHADNRNGGGGGDARRHRPVAPAARNDPPNTQTPENFGPLHVYLVGNTIYCTEGLCGRNADDDEVEVGHTGPTFALATIGLGGTVFVWLGVSFDPATQQFDLVDEMENEFQEYLMIGRTKVITAQMQTNKSSPAARPPVVDASSGVIAQHGVVYFLMATVKWLSGPAPTLQINREGNFDMVFIPPNRVFLVASE